MCTSGTSGWIQLECICVQPDSSCPQGPCELSLRRGLLGAAQELRPGSCSCVIEACPYQGSPREAGCSLPWFPLHSSRWGGWRSHPSDLSVVEVRALHTELLITFKLKTALDECYSHF